MGQRAGGKLAAAKKGTWFGSEIMAVMLQMKLLRITDVLVQVRAAALPGAHLGMACVPYLCWPHRLPCKDKQGTPHLLRLLQGLRRCPLEGGVSAAGRVRALCELRLGRPAELDPAASTARLGQQGSSWVW